MADATPNDPSFDSYAANYEDALNQGLKFTGEDRWFYARRRSQLTVEALAGDADKVGRILDFGCGTGTATRCLLEAFPKAAITGSDPSGESLEIAAKDHSGLNCKFVLPDRLQEEEPSDLAYTNGVFHHIPPPDRLAAACSVYEALKPGGYFAFWENNPWNPAVWFVMSRVPFDHDAIMLWPRETRGLLRAAGFRVLQTRFWFVFPGLLGALRPTERLLSGLPFGGQYMVLAQKPL